MTCTLVIPVPLRDLTGGEGSLNLPGDTVRAVLAELGRRYPPLLEKICTEGGDVRSFVNVYVNDVDIRYLHGLDTSLGDGDEVLLVPAIAGG